MNRRTVTLFVTLAFLLASSTAAAQFKKPKLGKKKEETKKEETKKEEKAEPASATSSGTMKAFTWADNGITAELPDNWDQMMLERDMASFMLTAGGESVGLSATISRMAADFPAEASLKAYRDDCPKQKEDGKMVSCEEYTLGNLPGILQVEAEKPDAEDVRRLTWIGFQKRGGWNQVTLTLSSKSGAFPKHEETLRKVLATFKIESE